MNGVIENVGIDCTNTARQIIIDHMDMISISLSRIEREFDEEENHPIPPALKKYISDVDDSLHELSREHAP